MKFTPISKVFARSLLTAFVMIASLNSFLSFGNNFNDQVLKSVEKHSSDYQILSNQVITYDGTATDQDGNTFEWINYGTQDWAIESAKVVTYRDGTVIPQVTDDNAWSDLATGAWSYYDNDSSKGKLYNWYAVAGIHDAASLSDPSLRKEIAPEGWRVPSVADWTTFENYLIANGYNYDNTTTGNKIAKAMASTTGWLSSNTSGAPGDNQSLNNSTGFNAIPEGYRFIDGTFLSVNNAYFWSSDEQCGGCPNSYRFAIYYNNPESSNNLLSSKRHGFSMRFVRDAVDSTPPTMTITSSDVTDGSSSNDSSISLTFTSSESTTDFNESHVTVTGGTISSFSGSGTTYNATFTPSGDGATTIDVAANTFTDSAGNGNTAASQFNWTYDGTSPTIVISSTVISDGSTVNNSSVVFNLEASESSSNFGQSDITVNGGTITGFSGGGTNYSATFTPSLDGAKTIQIVSGAFTDSAGNSNTPSNIFSFTFDSTPPTIDSISSSSGDGFYGEDEQIAVRIDFSEPVSLTNGLLNIVLETGANDRVVSIGSSNITSVTSATGTYTIISGDNSTNLDATQVNLSSGQLVDIAGNEMSDFIFSNNISSSSQIVIDTTPPTMDITAQVGATQIQEGSTTNDTSINLIFTFSENVKNFDVSDVIVSGGNISSFTKVSDSEFNAIYTPVGDGLKTIQVSSTSYNDFANNENSTDSSFNWNYESTTYPTIQIAEQNGLLSDGSLSSSTTLTFIFTASEDIKGFDENDIQIIGGEAANGTFSNFLKLSDKLYRITFSPTSDGDKTIFIPQGSYSDLFDYQNAQASQFSWVHDGTPLL